MKRKVIIIAEAGVNSNGNLKIAKRLIDIAADAKVDYIKFQTFKANKLVTKKAQRAKYQIKNTGSKESQHKLLKSLEMTEQMHYKIKEYCKSKKIKFFSTGFDIESLKFLLKLGMKIIKIPSGEINNVPFLKYIGKLNLPIILSTGMATMDEINFALKTLTKSGSRKKDISILHCTTQYPTPLKDVNLNAMHAIRKKFNINVGYSDHTLGLEVPIAAVAMGANIIEKHFTTDRKLTGPDHMASLEPKELKEMVKLIRNTEKALGSKIKKPTKIELENIKIARKSIVALKKIKKGDTFSDKNLTVKRPGTGLSPKLWDKVLGRKSKFYFEEDDFIKI